MKKTIILVSLLIISSYSTTCGDNPLIERLTNFVKKHEDNFDDPEVFDTLVTSLEGFDGASPTSVSDLEKCQQYNGGDSCCTNDVVENVGLITRAFVKAKLKKKPKLFGFLTKFGTAVRDCVDLSEAEGFFKGNNLKDSLSTIQECNQAAIKTQKKFIRGQICAICMDPADVSTYFDISDDENPKMKITAANLEEYADKMEESFTCYENAIPDIETTIQDFLDSLPDSCSDVVEKVGTFLEEKGLDFEAPECKSQAKMYGDGCLGNQQDDGDDIDVGGKRGGKKGNGDEGEQGGDGTGDGDGSGGGKKGRKLLEQKEDFAEGLLRILSGDESDFIEDAAGISDLYEENNSEEQAEDAEDASLYDDEDWAEQGLSDVQQQGELSGASNLGFYGILVLALMVIVL